MYAYSISNLLERFAGMSLDLLFAFIRYVLHFFFFLFGYSTFAWEETLMLIILPLVFFIIITIS